MRVVLQLSDPWEMGEALDWPHILGTVVNNNGDSLLVEIDHPFEYDNMEYRFVVVSPRHEGIPLKNAASEVVPCNMIRTTTERAHSNNPCDVSWWRGGHAMIGSITVYSAQPGAAERLH